MKNADKGNNKKKNPITAERMPDGSFVFHGRSYSTTLDKNKALEPFGCLLLQSGLQLLLLPDDGQAEMIRKTNGCARVVARDYLEKRQAFYNEKKKSLSVSEYKKHDLKDLKEEKPFLKEADKFALEAALEHVNRAYENFFGKKAGFPKYPSKYKPSGNRYTTKFTNNNIELLKGNDGLPYIKLPKGKTVKTLLPGNTRITSATVIKDGKNYLVSLQTECVIEKKEPLKTFTMDRIGALDLGLKEFAVWGSGAGERTHEENKHYIKIHEKRLRRFQQALSRKQYDRKAHKGSKNYYRAKEKVAKEQRKIANQRKDMHHKLSRKIADSFDVFVCEDLNIRGMLKNRHLAKEISSAGWGQFIEMVKYKIERKNGIFLKVSRWYPSSKTCAHCGYKNENLELKDRFWVCPECHTVINRDENSVDNLIKEGIRLLKEGGIYAVSAA